MEVGPPLGKGSSPDARDNSCERFAENMTRGTSGHLHGLMETQNLCRPPKQRPSLFFRLARSSDDTTTSVREKSEDTILEGSMRGIAPGTPSPGDSPASWKDEEEEEEEEVTAVAWTTCVFWNCYLLGTPSCFSDLQKGKWHPRKSHSASSGISPMTYGKA